MLRALLIVLAVFSTAMVDAREATRKTIEVDGVKRNYLLYKPRGTATQAAKPLVFVIHGGGGTARALYRETRDSYKALAEKHGFFLVYPNAGRHMWDFGTDVVSKKLRKRFDDRRFFESLLDHLTTSLPIDKNRVFATGISRGGQASYFLACNFPDRIRAIAPIAMPMPEFLAAECKAGPDIGLALMNGTADPVVPYNGGQIVALGQRRGHVLATSETLELWRQRNGCDEAESARIGIDPESDTTSVERVDWQRCSGAPVRFYKIDNGGHTWPSGNQYLPKKVVGPVTRDIDGAVEAWDFFSSFK